jgi:hypothetical protein
MGFGSMVGACAFVVFFGLCGVVLSEVGGCGLVWGRAPLFAAVR